jgi:mannosyltransferase OCH1-like enzyme
MKIPRIIHQTWKDHNVPQAYRQMAHSWRKQHPKWEYRFWTDDMNRNFIAANFPYFLSVYDNYSNPIQRVDAVRYFALLKYGGFYIDMDFECLASIDLLVQNADCVFGMEPAAHCLIHEKDMIISNAFMGAVPGSPFIEQICRELLEKRNLTDHPNNRILESTGPFMLSRIYSQYENKEEVSLLEADLLYPVTKEELEKWNEDPSSSAIKTKLKHAYGIHHYAGTWWKK